MIICLFGKIDSIKFISVDPQRIGYFVMSEYACLSVKNSGIEIVPSLSFVPGRTVDLMKTLSVCFFAKETASSNILKSCPFGDAGTGTEITMPPSMPENVKTEAKQEAVNESLKEIFSSDREIFGDDEDV